MSFKNKRRPYSRVIHCSQVIVSILASCAEQDVLTCADRTYICYSRIELFVNANSKLKLDAFLSRLLFRIRTHNRCLLKIRLEYIIGII